MKFRLGLVVGGVIGYVLGARAGRERYDDIKRWWGIARQHPAVDQLAGQAKGVSDLGRSVVAGGLDRGSKRLRDQI